MKPTKAQISAAASALGRKGGQSRSSAKADAVRKNGRKGGWWAQKRNQTPKDQ